MSKDADKPGLAGCDMEFELAGTIVLKEHRASMTDALVQTGDERLTFNIHYSDTDPLQIVHINTYAFQIENAQTKRIFDIDLDVGLEWREVKQLRDSLTLLLTFEDK